VSFLNILEAAKAHGGCNVLFSSSATVYGEAEQLPVTEQTPRLPATSPYGNTKTMCEDILRDTVRAVESIKGIALRYFNPIGAHPSALIGELPRGVPNNLVPFITQTAIGKRECLSIFGNDYPTEDGTCLRDYIDIVDLAKAHVAAVSRMVDGKMKEDYEIFNVGTGHPVSVQELVDAFEKVNDLNVARLGALVNKGKAEIGLALFKEHIILDRYTRQTSKLLGSVSLCLAQVLDSACDFLQTVIHFCLFLSR
jgi:UDP-glucose 4-epimerase